MYSLREHFIVCETLGLADQILLSKKYNNWSFWFSLKLISISLVSAIQI